MSEMSEQLEQVLSKLDDKSRNSLRFGADIESRRLETPSLGLTRALYGGWLMGTMGLIWGAKAAGKTALALEQIALAQRQGLVCAWLDAEGAFDKEWAKQLGVDVDELIVSKAGTVNSFANTGRELIAAGVDVIVVDSVSFLLPATFLDKNGELKDFEDTGAIGGLARSIGPALSQLTYVQQSFGGNTFILLISQARSGPKGGMHWGLNYTGGKAVDHAVSQAVRLTAYESKESFITDTVAMGDILTEKAVGRKITWQVDKSRGGPGIGLSNDYNLFFDGEYVGIDNVGEIIDLGVELGVIKKAGAWYTYNDSQLGQGKNKAADKLRDNAGLFEEVKGQIL